MKPHTPPRVLTIAGSDSGGGAGIQADLKTFAALGCYGTSVITALTAQNTDGVRGIHEVPPDFVKKQIIAILDDIGTDAVKTGMLQSAEIVRVTARTLRRRRMRNIVIDPVMIAKGGSPLLQTNAVAALCDELIPLAAIVTPNFPEAEHFAGIPIDNRKDAEEAGRKILSLGARAVLVKGGHGNGQDSSDCLCIAEPGGKIQIAWFDGRRIHTRNTHGTGCTLSSAIAAFLARGYGIREAVGRAKRYLEHALRAGQAYAIGRGHGPVHHFYALWK